MKHIPPRVDEALAWKLVPRQGRPLRMPWRGERAPASSRLPRLELIWLPYYLFDFRGTSINGEKTLTVSVQGHCAAFAFFEMHELLAEGEPPGPFFPPRMTEFEALESGRLNLVSTLLRVRRIRGRFTPQEVIAQGVVQYPYWICYFLRRGGLIDFKTLDAVTGEPAASKLKDAIIWAFCREHDGRTAAGSRAGPEGLRRPVDPRAAGP